MRYDGAVYRTPKTECKNCMHRHLACHDTCPSYQKAMADWRDHKQLIKANKQGDRLALAHEIENTLISVKLSRR